MERRFDRVHDSHNVWSPRSLVCTVHVGGAPSGAWVPHQVQYAGGGFSSAMTRR